MLLTTDVYIKQWSNYIVKLEALGYQLPKYTGVSGKEVYSTRQPLLVKVEHLMPSSKIAVVYRCGKCKLEIKVPFNKYSKNKHKICEDCSKRSKRGLPQAEEHIKNRARALTGLKRTPEQCAAMSVITKSLGMVGEQHPMYNPNLTMEDREHSRQYPAYKEWRTSIFEKDNFTCAICGVRGGGLEAHHLYNYSSNKELRTAVDNGVTLCKRCHFNFHSQFGRQHNTPEQLVNYTRTTNGLSGIL